jgi:hypothetical protein
VEARESVGTEYLISDPAPTTTAPGASRDGWPTWVRRPALLLPLQEDKSVGRRTELLLTEFEGSLGCDWFFEFWCGPQKPSPFVAELRECRENRQQSRCGNKLQTSMRGLSVWERGAEKPIG